CTPARPCCSFSFPHPASPPFSSLSLHDALPIWRVRVHHERGFGIRILFAHGELESVGIRAAIHARQGGAEATRLARNVEPVSRRSEEHTSELQSLTNLACRLLLEKKQKRTQSPR